MQCLNRSVSLPLARWLLARHLSTKLFVGGLSYDTNETVLKDAFGKYGEVIEVKVICHRVYGESKGYGFVHCWMTEISVCIMLISGHEEELLSCLIHYTRSPSSISVPLDVNRLKPSILLLNCILN
ncbi:RNA recognition motif domain [Populus alba x Populus x berolinensis]|nr:RNA recognition motif domain [Populus alba x Populus x berolinensis]